MGIRFFDQFVIYAPIISGIVIFILSFNEKIYQIVVENFDEEAAPAKIRLLRIIGPFLVFSGILQYFLQ